MSQADIHLPQVPDKGRRRQKFLETAQRGPWWASSSLILLGLIAFLIHGTWAAFHGLHYYYHGPAGQNYLSPFFSPLFFDTLATIEAGKSSGHAFFDGSRPGWWPAFLMFAPTMLVLWAPAGFRFTCYGFRGHYYKGVWMDPPSCAVGEPGFRGKKYRGERKWPLILQNSHRYFFYVIVVLLLVKYYDTFHMLFFYNDPADHSKGASLGVGLGTLILLAEPILLTLYVGGCHSLRHLIAGRFDSLSKTGVRKPAYDCVSCLNRKHMVWGWASLLWIMVADVYVRLCSTGVIHDIVFFKL